MYSTTKLSEVFALTGVIEDMLQSCDLILTIGLRRDPEGILAHFKSINPKGVIIAIDLKQPCYLDDNDLLLPMDLQEAISELVEER